MSACPGSRSRAGRPRCPCQQTPRTLPSGAAAGGAQQLVSMAGRDTTKVVQEAHRAAQPPGLHFCPMASCGVIPLPPWKEESVERPQNCWATAHCSAPHCAGARCSAAPHLPVCAARLMPMQHAPLLPMLQAPLTVVVLQEGVVCLHQLLSGQHLQSAGSVHSVSAPGARNLAVCRQTAAVGGGAGRPRSKHRDGSQRRRRTGRRVATRNAR